MTTANPGTLGVRALLKILVAAILACSLVVGLAFWIHPVLGFFALLLTGFMFTFGVAPALAGQMIKALILARQVRQAKQVEGGTR